MWRLPLLLLIIMWLSACQVPLANSSLRMVYGQTPSNQDPASWSAVALVDSKGEVFCSGTLIAPQLVVSAAHCVFDKRTEDLRIAFGSTANGGTAVQLLVLRKETFKKNQKFESNFDVAWLSFEGSVPSPYRPIEIWHGESELKADSSLTIAGYGATASNCDVGDASCEGGSILKVDTNVREFVRQGRIYDLIVVEGEKIDDAETRSGPCFGDSGGPAYLKRGDRWYLVGSFMGWDRILVPEEMATVCDQGQGIYTYLGTYAAWIEKSSGIPLSYDPATNPRAKAKALMTLNELPETFAAWCAYDNYEDPAWYTVQRLIRQASDFRLAREGVAAARAVFEDCAFAETSLRELIATGEPLSILGYDPERFVDSARIEDVRPLASLASMNLKGLILSDHSIPDLSPLTKIASLEQLEVLDNMPEESGEFDGAPSFRVQELPNLQKLKIQNSTAPLNLEGLGQLPNLVQLQLAFINFDQALDLANPMLENLRIEAVKTPEKLSFDRLRKLRTLTLSKIPVGELPPSLPSLEVLQLIETSQVLSLPEELPALKNLVIYGSDFAGTLSLNPWKNLENVSVIANLQLKKISSISDLSKLKDLEISDNSLEPLAEIARLPQLVELSLVRNKLTALPLLSDMPSLKKLDLEGNLFKTLPQLSGLSSLEWLNLNNNALRSLEGVAGLPKLKRLTARNTPGAGLQTLEGLAALPALDDLNLSRNSLSSADVLASFPQVRVLVLSDNKITDLSPLKALDQLEYLEVVNNPLTSRVCPVAGPNVCRFEWTSFTGNIVFPI